MLRNHLLLTITLLTITACDEPSLDSCDTGSTQCIDTGGTDGGYSGAPSVCGTEDGQYLFIDYDEVCDAGYVQYCFVGKYSSDAAMSVCCDPNGPPDACVLVAYGTECANGWAHVCDSVFG